jgi:YD repeat-containing protein
MGGVQSFSYDAVGNMTRRTDQNGHITQFAYDALDRRTTEIDALGGTTLSTYDPEGNLVSITDANSHTTSFTFDNRNRLVGRLDPSGGMGEFTYDAVGNQVLEIDPLGQTTTFLYDSLNRLIASTDALGATTTHAYDALGNRTSTTDPLGRTTTFTYDELNRLISTTDARGSVVQFAYDAVGNQTSVTDSLGQTTLFAYDALDRLIEQTDPLGNSSTFLYDAVDNLLESTDRNGRVRRFAYDALERQVQETWWDGGSLLRTIEFSYDPVGNMLSASDPDSTYTFAYDALNRQTTLDNAGTAGVPNVVLFYLYDAAGNRISASDNLGVSVTSTYDSRDLLTSRVWQGPSINPARVDFSYNPRGDHTQTHRFADIAGTQATGRSSFDYDAVGRLTAIRHRDALDAVLAEYDYMRDLANQLVNETHHGQSSDYLYDTAGQLTSAGHSSQDDELYTYDANGNRIGSGIVVGPNNRLLSDGTFDYTYDAEGNLVSKTQIASGETISYSYDHRNRLVRAEHRTSGGTLLNESTYLYDVFDRRIAKRVDGDGSGPQQAEEKRFVYDRQHVWADFDGAGMVTARYLFGEQTDQILARFRPGEGTAWYLTDHLGTVRDIVDATGAVIDHIDYDSFGTVMLETGGTAGDRYKFTGWKPKRGQFTQRNAYN